MRLIISSFYFHSNSNEVKGLSFYPTNNRSSICSSLLKIVPECDVWDIWLLCNLEIGAENPSNY